jgi:hypothetical protein
MTKAKEISQSQFADILNTPKLVGNFYFKKTDQAEPVFVGLIRATDNFLTERFKTEQELNQWFDALGYNDLFAGAREHLDGVEAALEFVPEGEPIPYDAATEGLVVTESTYSLACNCKNCDWDFYVDSFDLKGVTPLCPKCGLSVGVEFDDVNPPLEKTANPYVGFSHAELRNKRLSLVRTLGDVAGDEVAAEKQERIERIEAAITAVDELLYPGLSFIEIHFIELDRQKKQHSKFFEDLKAAAEAVHSLHGYGHCFQDDEGIVYRVTEPRGRFVDYKRVEIEHTRRTDEAKGSLSIKEAKELGFTPFEEKRSKVKEAAA